MSAVKIPLAQMIDALRLELATSIDQAKGSSLQFELEEIDLELQVGVSQTAGANGRVEFSVFGIGVGGGAEKARQDELVHTFRLKLRPRAEGKDGSRGSLLVSDHVAADRLEE